jgi:hypothetical protein
MDLKLHIVLQKPTTDVDFGLQKGSGNTYETVQVQRSSSQDLHFDLTIVVKGERQKDSLPGLTGPFVQGANPNKFIYIDIGTYAGETSSCWSRRLKIPLTGITWDIVEKVNADSQLILETCVPGTGKDGGPNCATVKPFEGWKVKVG